MNDILLIGCSADKQTRRLAARELYCSPRFNRAKLLAERLSARWFIISAKHGLLDPSTELDPYDLPLEQLPIPKRHEWARSVVLSLKSAAPGHKRVTVLAPDPYASILEPFLTAENFVFRSPLAHRIDNIALVWLDDALGTSPRSKHLTRFYATLGRLINGLGRNRSLDQCGNGSDCPRRGVYFFFDPEQCRIIDSTTHRVVRVGTHAVSTGSKATLWNRLRTHRGTGNGGGNHRSSIMRLHIGAAMLAKAGHQTTVPTWGRGQVADAATRHSESQIEIAVTEYIRAMLVTWIAIDDLPSPLSDRAYIEQNAIGLLAGPTGPLDVADSAWLGTASPTEAIRRSSLWNIDYVDNTYDPAFLDVFDTYVDVTLGRIAMPPRSLAPEYWHGHKYGNDVRGQMGLFRGD